MAIPYKWIEFIYHAGSFRDCNSGIRSRLIVRGKDLKEGRQTACFTAMDPMNEPQKDELYDVTEPQEVPYRTKWKECQNAMDWIKP